MFSGRYTLVVGGCRLVGLDPDQLSLQAPFPEGLPAPMAWQLAPGGFMLRSGRPACGPISLLAQESGCPQLRPESAFLFSGWPQDIFGLIFLRQGPQKQQDVKKEAFEPDGKALKSGVQNDIEFFVVKKRVHPKNKTNY